MFRKMMIQTLICLMLFFAVYMAKNSEIPGIRSGTEKALSYMAVNYTLEEIKDIAGKTTQVFSPIYGEPIDEEYEGEETPVHAVGAGKVTSAGENEEIGKYIKITHGDGSESLYGNLKEIRIGAPAKVKKGQIIGIYNKSLGEEFYYSFKKAK